ncbi:hypothetical protein GCM10022288_15390 [Gryllotalpicola kribbensis]|uniref:Type IV secretion protein Rhs n=1 Tax=Gryllotalpicola kribbensis TaxID=993084 RepID=A0ABP8AS59_9MICO
MVAEAKGFWSFYQKANRVVRTFTGPAQIGAGHPEAPEVRNASAPCPICGHPMTEHEVLRAADQREPTRLVCPTA